jgi:pantoate--beta-alanine ligase
VTPVRSIRELRDALEPAWRRGARIGLVPTMGAFHAGHVALMAAARDECDVTVVSLFVNPTQFGPAEDLTRYPRDEARDLAVAAEAGVDIVFLPDAAEMYPSGFDTHVDPGALGTVLEGAVRPGHFRGVATVCTKLFTLVRPHVAFFGRKDAQQVAVIRQVVRDLDLDVEIRAHPTVRDADGLALSSRNGYLSPDERSAALALPRSLDAGVAAHTAGTDPVAAARAVLEAERALAIDYVAVADFDGPTLVAAVRVGTTRLIDNVDLAAGGGPLTSGGGGGTLDG